MDLGRRRFGRFGFGAAFDVDPDVVAVDVRFADAGAVGSAVEQHPGGLGAGQRVRTAGAVVALVAGDRGLGDRATGSVADLDAVLGGRRRRSGAGDGGGVHVDARTGTLVGDPVLLVPGDGVALERRVSDLARFGARRADLDGDAALTAAIRGAAGADDRVVGGLQGRAAGDEHSVEAVVTRFDRQDRLDFQPRDADGARGADRDLIAVGLVGRFDRGVARGRGIDRRRRDFQRRPRLCRDVDRFGDLHLFGVRARAHGDGRARGFDGFLDGAVVGVHAAVEWRARGFR